MVAELAKVLRAEIWQLVLQIDSLLNSRFFDCLTICRSVSAIYASAREIDEYIRIF